ncbi:MAG: TlpA family protein disulfide reductase [Candidatus Scalindua sp.]|jgi:peroxiredoxin|nr:TlpA family protein disulfide reductase [Candidatus Scalindua sp.]MBT5304261.1 TlpA family protein disulfide reductase [Candidatus Scalindua sp.]MBT6050400.1 TlpA family protein disulfide reductase [Candidatus Scalindua sp.]MBT6226546.1 TlpA family protein disulfide reductase [Candidatus Scalindua sp.]MBT6564916.1 TlpA family protein disulfide reductase [Candidatus Scalindua sp.]
MDLITRLFAISLLSILGMFVLPFSASDDNVFAEVETGVDIGKRAAPFTLLTLDGKEIELGSFAKDKVTLLVFGATWCPSCRHEIPLLKEFYTEFKDQGLNVLGIDIQESAKKVKSLVDKKKINYPVVLDSKADVARLYKVMGIPLNIVLDKSGVIVYKANRPPDKKLLKKLL